MVLKDFKRTLRGVWGEVGVGVVGGRENRPTAFPWHVKCVLMPLTLLLGF